MPQEDRSRSSQADLVRKVPEVPAFSIKYMDLQSSPEDDFYSYSVGNWLRNHPVPADKAAWGAFDELLERNNYLLREILENCASNETKEDTGSQMLGRFYESAMNTDIIENLKFGPIAKFMEKIDKISTAEELIVTVSGLHSTGIPALFHPYSDSDKKNSSIYAMYLDQGGLSLPDREYYLSENFKIIREQYVQHLKKMFMFFGASEIDAQSYSKIIISLETEIAKFNRSQADLRDAEKNYNRVEMAEIAKRFPDLHLKEYFGSVGLSEVGYVVIGQPEFFESLQKLLLDRPIEEWKVYLRWAVLNSSAPFLHSAVEQEHFDFYNKKLLGQQEPEPRWKLAISAIDGSVGEALGELYVKKYFGEEAKKRMAEMIKDISEVFREKLKKLAWMSEDTRELALKKFNRFRTKIGHPEKFRDYSSIVVKEDDYLGNLLRSAEFEFNRQIARVGRPIDRNEWYMSPPTVNAYFSPTDNEIVFPAGILQPPFFDVSMDDAVNYGAIGGVISHEITHGYDDQGRKFDADGNLNDWWNRSDGEEFNSRAKKVVDLFSSIEVLPGIHINGQLTLGENIADFGGVSCAYEALQRKLERNPELRTDIDGLSPEQRFFISWAQVWRQNIRDPELKRRITIDPHAPDRYRALLPAQNHPGFDLAFRQRATKNGREKETEKISIW